MSYIQELKKVTHREAKYSGMLDNDTCNLNSNLSANSIENTHFIFLNESQSNT